jgi:TatD DNase family protein
MPIDGGPMRITDTHAHLFWESFRGDFEDVLARARAAGVERMVVVGTDVESSRAAFETCARAPGLFPTAGIHPHDARESDPTARSEIEALCARKECVGVGETGLDYFRMLAEKELQRENFLWHLELAKQLGKPVVVHCRDAHRDTVELLRAVPGVRGVMHCYSMGPDELAPYLELGFWISFSGMVTYPKNEANREAARIVPGERIVFETDCPYLAPQGRRGRRNEPAFVREVVESVARVRGEEPAELAERSSRNAATLFALPPL